MPNMFKLDDKQIMKFHNKLTRVRESAIPFATKATLNDLAFYAQRESRKKVSKDFINRNKFSQSSVRVDKARGNDINSQKSIVGSIASYMKTQEEGGTKVAKGSQGVPIATSYAAGQGENAIPRTNLVKGNKKMAKIVLSRKKSKGSRKRKNFIAIKQASESINKFVFLDLQKSKGIFKVINKGKRTKLKMVYDMSHRSVRIKKHEWLKPSFDITLRKLPDFYHKNLKFQLRRLGY